MTVVFDVLYPFMMLCREVLLKFSGQKLPPKEMYTELATMERCRTMNTIILQPYHNGCTIYYAV